MENLLLFFFLSLSLSQSFPLSHRPGVASLSDCLPSNKRNYFLNRKCFSHLKFGKLNESCTSNDRKIQKLPQTWSFKDLLQQPLKSIDRTEMAHIVRKNSNEKEEEEKE